MTDRPILFRPALQALIREGHKTQTRRTDMRLARLKTGDRLWVREQLELIQRPWGPDIIECAHYRSDGVMVLSGGQPVRWRWRNRYLSPLHMPREACRLWLRLTQDARVERICDITDDDAFAEGVDRRPDRPGGDYVFRLGGMLIASGPSPRTAFTRGWRLIHGEDADMTRETVVLTFEVLP